MPSCRDCPPPPIAWSRAPFLYDGPVRQALMRMKFGGNRSVAEGLAPFMVSALERAPPGWLARGRPDVETVAEPPPLLTWVPLGRYRRRARGFDQAEALARAVAMRSGLHAEALLRRIVETAPQAQRGGTARRLALDGWHFPCLH